MCRHGTLKTIHVIRRNNDDIPDGWHEIRVDACIADYVQAMNDLGIVTVGCCCGHGERQGEVLIAPESVHDLEMYGHSYIWPKDDPLDKTDWWRGRTDIVIHRLPQLEKTWDEYNCHNCGREVDEDMFVTLGNKDIYLCGTCQETFSPHEPAVD